MLKIKDLANYINVTNIPNDWTIYYEEAMESFDEAWYNSDDLENFISFYEFDNDFANFIRDLWFQINSDINLIFLVYLWYYILYKIDIEKRNKWDFKLSYFRNNGSLYMPMISMLMGYKIHELNMKDYDLEQINIQKKIIREACISDYKIYGIPGMRFSNMEWASRFIWGEIVQIGIFQYEFKKNYLDQEDVIFIHIPRSNGFTKKIIDNSLNRKEEVFKYFNAPKDIKFVTFSWLLSPDLRCILKDDSNILYFQNKFDLIFTKENKKDFLKFVFNEPFEINDYNILKEETSLQKNIKNKLINKEKLYIGLGILK